MAILKFEALTKAHEVIDFDCGIPALNIWLQTVAKQHQKSGTSKTFVLAFDNDPTRVIGFFAMALRVPTIVNELPSAMQKLLPDVVSGYTLARLAVASEFKGEGYGEKLLMKAMQKAQHASKLVAGFGLFVDAKEGAASFYEKYGFSAFPDDNDILVYPIADMPEFPNEAEI